MKVIPVFYIWVSLLLFVVAIPSAEAASLYIDPGMSSINRGDSITMSVRLDTDEAAGECVNAVDAVVTYSTNIEPVDVSIGDSILNIWVEQPIINKAERTITFAGGIPNGYCGRVVGDPRLSNILTKIVFRSPGFMIGGGDTNETEAIVEFTDESTAYLNDGFGTKAPLKTYGAKIELSQKPGTTIQNEWKEQVEADNIPPEEFTIELVKDDTAFSGKYYIVFNTSDKQTGIDHYEVMEEPLSMLNSFQWGGVDAPWLDARSPYVLEDQNLNITIRVKAVDKAGNEYIATLIPDESLRTTPAEQKALNYILIVGVVLLVVVVAGAIWFATKRRKTWNEKKSESVEKVKEDENKTDEVPGSDSSDENDIAYDDE